MAGAEGPAAYEFGTLTVKNAATLKKQKNKQIKYLYRANLYKTSLQLIYYDKQTTLYFVNNTGGVFLKAFSIQGIVNRVFGLPSTIIERDPESGATIREEWRRGGDRHREDGPAVIMRDPASGVAIREEWRRDDKLHRVDGPAVITRDPVSGIVTNEEWKQHGKLHREGGPAHYSIDPATGVITTEGWRQDGKLHRDSGPAVIRRDPASEVPILEEYWHHGKPQNPTVIHITKPPGM